MQFKTKQGNEWKEAVAKVKVPVTNYALDPSFEGNLTGIQLRTTPYIVEKSTDWAETGENSLKIEAVNNGNNDTFCTMPISWLSKFLGKRVRIQATARIEEVLLGSPHERARRIYVTTFHPVATLPAALHLSPQVPNEVGTHKIDWILDIPNTSLWFWRLYNGHRTGTIYWDDICITEAEYTGDYFDGNSPNAIWNGTPNASTSQKSFFLPLKGTVKQKKNGAWS